MLYGPLLFCRHVHGFSLTWIIVSHLSPTASSHFSSLCLLAVEQQATKQKKLNPSSSSSSSCFHLTQLVIFIYYSSSH